jgi:hypothetical protein
MENKNKSLPACLSRRLVASKHREDGSEAKSAFDGLKNNGKQNGIGSRFGYPIMIDNCIDILKIVAYDI